MIKIAYQKARGERTDEILELIDKKRDFVQNNFVTKSYSSYDFDEILQELRQKITALKNQNPQDKKGCGKKHVGYYDVICDEDYICDECQKGGVK